MKKGDLNPKPLQQFVETAVLNTETFEDYYSRLRLLALTMFEWENLPDSMDARYLEESLYYFGLACFCPDKFLGWLSLPCLPSAELNIYGEAIKYTVYSRHTDYSKTYDRDEIVLVRNNLQRIPTDLTVRLFARRLYEAERAIDVNIKSQKTPVLITCTDKQRLTLKQVYQKYDGNEPVIFGDKNLDISGINVLKTDSPYVADKIIQYKQNVWSEFLSFIGVNNTPYEKSAQLVSDEINANNQMLMLSAETMLNTRKYACEKFNEKTGYNIEVKLRTYDDFAEMLYLQNTLGNEETEGIDRDKGGA